MTECNSSDLLNRLCQNYHDFYHKDSEEKKEIISIITKKLEKSSNNGSNETVILWGVHGLLDKVSQYFIDYFTREGLNYKIKEENHHKYHVFYFDIPQKEDTHS